MKTFIQWLLEQDDYSKAVADNITKMGTQQLGATPGASSKPDKCATDVIQKAAIKAVNPSNVADAIAATGKTITDKKMKK